MDESNKSIPETESKPVPETPLSPETKSSVDHKFTWALAAIAGLIVILLIFQLGEFVGYHKANNSFAWSANYHLAFGGPGGGVLQDYSGRDFINGHGTAGSIAKIDGNTIIIKGSDGVEKNINITATTSIRDGSENVQINQLKMDQSIVVIGSPQSDGSIQAEIIRAFDSDDMPTPPTQSGFRFKFPF